MTMRRVAMVLVLVLFAVVWRLDRRNPESMILGDQARALAGGAFVHLPDGFTHYEVAGPEQGARIVLIHGFSVPAYIWDSTFVALANAGFRVARYDTYGRGWSDRPDTRYDFSLYDRQLVGLLDSLGWKEPVHVMGLSFGGPVSSTFVSRHPERVNSHVLVDPAAGEAQQLPWYIAAPVVGPLLWRTLAVPAMAANQSTDFVDPSKWPDWADRYRVQQQFPGFSRALRATLMDNATVRSDSLYAAAGKAGKPTLLIWGTEDQTVPIAKAALVRAGIPQAEFHPIEKAGHLPQLEQAAAFNALVIPWLTSHSASSTAQR